MSRGPCTFRQRDLKAAIKAAEDSGHYVTRFEISPDGSIVVWLDQPAEDAKALADEWDKILEGPAAVRSRVP
jgi:hypothetical protein